MKKKLSFLITVCFSFLLLFLVTSCGVTTKEESTTKIETTTVKPNETTTAKPDETITGDVEETTTTTEEDIYHTVVFKVDGEVVASIKVKDGATLEIPDNIETEIEGYTFLGFTKDREAFDLKTKITENITLEASYKVNTYTVEAKAFDDTLSVSGGNSYTYGSKATLSAIVNEGYTFLGWYLDDEKVSSDLSYEFVVKEDIELVAKTTPNSNTKYTVKHFKESLTGEYEFFEEEETHGTTKAETTAVAKEYEGFEAKGFSQATINADGSTVVNIYYARNNYALALNINNSLAGTIQDVSGTYKYGEEITLAATTNEGYTFLGWYDGETKVSSDSSYTFSMPAKNVSLEARYTINKYTITLDNQTGVSTISGITSGNEYEYNTEITLTATDIPKGYFIKWTRSDGVVYVGNSYTFNVPAIDITITVTSAVYQRIDNTIYCGTYPQTSVTDETLISSLNTLAGTLPTSSALGNWTDYNYYIEDTITSYMYYQDIDYDSDGDYDYRGVYFTQYRPYLTSKTSSTDNSYQDNNGYSTGTVYWFKYDPIEWDILTESDGKALIIANLILDSQDYYPSTSQSFFSHNGVKGYGNNYELSNIRKWLNDTFYNAAFNDLQKAIIEITEVDNSAASTGDSSNEYACNNTNDKMFLLSYKELTTYYTSDEARKAAGTDYAKCQGLLVSTSSSYLGYSVWRSRSPFYDYANCAYSVYGDGRFCFGDLGNAAYGIRPVCWINL